MTTAADFIEPLRRLHNEIRDLVVCACESHDTSHLAQVAHEGSGDVIYAIDRISETALVDWFNREIAAREPIILIGEGLPNGRMLLPGNASESNARWRIIVDPIDGTRGLMYQKRPGWILTGVARNRGEETSLADIEVAVQTEIPLIKQHLGDQVWAVRGQGAHGIRINRLTGDARPLAVQPSTATSLRHGFATICRFFPGGRDITAAIDEELCERVVPRHNGEVAVFEDQYASTGGQIYNLAIGQDRFITDLRPLVQPVVAAQGRAVGHCCHPYDLCTKLIAEEAGAIIADPAGGSVVAPLDTESNVAWAGYANDTLHQQISPVLIELFYKYGLVAPLA